MDNQRFLSMSETVVSSVKNAGITDPDQINVIINLIGDYVIASQLDTVVFDYFCERHKLNDDDDDDH